MTSSTSRGVSVAPEIQRQREYYAQTAGSYDDWHLQGDPQHRVALAFLDGMIQQRSWSSVLDVGAGTGRTLLYLSESQPSLDAFGVEPVEELRRVGHAKGISEERLRDGDGSSLPFSDASFDVVCAFAVLHHVHEPAVVVAEMLRVARSAIFISDSNCFGQGGPALRAIKQLSYSLGCWPFLNYLKTRGKGYVESEGDGIAYSYSVFQNETLLRSRCRQVYFMNTEAAGRNPFRSSGHVAVLGVK